MAAPIPTDLRGKLQLPPPSSTADDPIIVTRSDYLRPPHANPLVEAVFQRIEAGEKLLPIMENITGLRRTDAGERRGNGVIYPDPVEQFAYALILATIAPGTQYSDGQALRSSADLAAPQDENNA